jgi:hypothetical protein
MAVPLGLLVIQIYHVVEHPRGIYFVIHKTLLSFHSENTEANEQNRVGYRDIMMTT